MTYFSYHNHSHYSNFRLKDAINRPEEIIKTALDKGLKGIALTDHEVLSGQIKFKKAYESMKDQLPEGFKIGHGNEIYLINRDQEQAMLNHEPNKYHHFILLAKNQRGWDFLKKQSSKAWSNSMYSRGMERVPTFKDELKELMKDYKGDVIATTACVGGEIPQLCNRLEESIEANDGNESNIKKEIHLKLSELIDIFGKDDLYLELQPSKNREQLVANKWLYKLGKSYGLKCTVATDAHYLTKEQANLHKAYLTSAEGEREVDLFYATTYIFSHDELLEYFKEDQLKELEENTLHIMDQIEEIEFGHETVIPQAHIPENFDIDDESMKLIDRDKYPHIWQMKESKEKMDRYYHELILKGFNEKNLEYNDEHLSRIDIEYSELLSISYQLGQPMSSYFVLMKEFIDITWEISLVGVARGSASCFFTNYLLDIVQINPLKFDLPHWRFLSKEYIGEFPDIDFDTEGSKRLEIVRLIKEKYGEDSFLNYGTFTTEGTRSTILTACRSIGLSPDEGQNIAQLAPNDKGKPWPLHDAFYGNEDKGRKPAHQFIKEVEAYDGLKDLMLGFEGLVSGRGQHASGASLFTGGYTKYNAMMKTTSGLPITQFDAGDSEFSGAIKYDFLSIVSLDQIRTAMQLLLDRGKIEWQGSLRATYNKYLHPDVLELEAPEMYQLLFDNQVPDAFQFSTKVGRQTLENIKAENFDEIAAANSLMRLTADGEQPVDKFIRYKNDISEWEKDMDKYNLSKDEKALMHELMDSRYGVCDTQELLMQLAMNEKTAKFNLREGKALRKACAKQDPKKQEEQKVKFFEKGLANGTSENLLSYIWNECFVPTFG